ncbi:hypothetical protein B0H14DRAFT_3785783 [Mycena olivaceomarginata]|nr:hypothetical protein B0H14DRAFT_3785783 [Mycena olivaceomarginata]
MATISLFLLSTTHCALFLASTTYVNMGLGYEIDPLNSFLRLEVLFKHYTSLNCAANAIYVTSKSVHILPLGVGLVTDTDDTELFRCYAIWNFRRQVIIFPAILIFCVAASGYAEVVLSVQREVLSTQGTSFASFVFNISIGISIFATVVLMCLSGGRIWWLSRVARPLIGRKMTDWYRTVCALILESGALYCAGAITFLVISQLTATSFITSGAILGQLVGMAPTIITVRVGLGHSVEHVGSSNSTHPRHRSQAKAEVLPE